MFKPNVHKKIIFLDIDGVLNNYASMAESIELDSRCVILLRQIVEATDAVIVLSSTWRILYSKEVLEGMFQVTGFPYINIIDITPNHDNHSRGYEIQKWMEAHPGDYTYVILDDDTDMLEEQLPFFHNTYCGTGLITRHIGGIIESLNTGEPIKDDSTPTTLDELYASSLDVHK